MYYLWGFVCELPEIPVSCAYFEILLVVYEMTDPLLGAPSQCHIHHLICRNMSSPCSDLGRFIILSSIFFFHTVIYLLDFIPLIFTFITHICLLILSLTFHSTSFSSYLSYHMLHFLHRVIIISTSVGCSCVHGS